MFLLHITIINIYIVSDPKKRKKIAKFKVPAAMIEPQSARTIDWYWIHPHQS